MYRVTEGLQREKQSLMKQLDLLRYSRRHQTWSTRNPGPLPNSSSPTFPREMNKHLKDERDICCGMVSTATTGGLCQGPGPVNPGGSGRSPQSKPNPTTGSASPLFVSPV